MNYETKEHDQLINLTGKHAIVTGGAVGIGQGITHRLAEAGAKVLVADFNEKHIEEAKQAFKDKGWEISYVLCDVSRPDGVSKMVETAKTELGGIDILVNNAGVYPNILLMNMNLEEFDRVLSVNLKGVFLTTKAVAEVMIAQGNGGKVINITSIDALHPSSAGLAHYDASKHGVWGFTKNVAIELAQHNIWVNAVAPGGITTPGVKETQQSMQLPKGADMSELLEKFMARIPMHRMGEPDEIGKVVLFLASDMSSYMTGSQIVVDGGALLS